MANGKITLLERIFQNSTMLLVMAVLMVLIMIIVPLPVVFLDFLMIVNMLLSLIIIITVISSKRALDFSIFPTILLFTTVFRLAVNVSSTRLILTQGSSFSGQVIRAFADFVVSGNYVVGIIVFIIIMVIQFMVITKGATRVSEVSARFKLDAIPGKQMAIDADLNAGLIDEQEALRRRQEINQEADFYGSMDGASKFVSGDVIASIIITLINIIGGLIVGMAIHNESFDLAISSYVRFAVGDGLVASLPALMISTSTGIIVTRAVSEESLGEDLKSQILMNPMAYYITGGFAAVLTLVPGFPKLIFLMVAALLFYLGYSIKKISSEKEIKKDVASEQEELKEQTELTPEKMTEMVQVDPLEIELGYGLISLVDENAGGDLLERIKKTRKQMVLDMGLVVPKVRITDNMQLEPEEYSIKINGAAVGGSKLVMSKLLAMNASGSDVRLDNEQTTEPVFGLPAYWINNDEKEDAEKKGYTIVDCPTVVATHLSEILKRNAAEIMSRKEVKAIIESVRKRNPSLIEEVEKMNIKAGDIQKVLQNLLEENVSIRNIDTILEVVCDYGPSVSSHETLTEYVREVLKRQISAQHSDPARNLHTIIFSSELENELINNTSESEGQHIINLTPDSLNALIENIGNKINDVRKKGHAELLVVDPVLRRPLRHILSRNYPGLAILSIKEIAEGYKLDVVETV